MTSLVTEKNIFITSRQGRGACAHLQRVRQLQRAVVLLEDVNRTRLSRAPGPPTGDVEQRQTDAPHRPHPRQRRRSLPKEPRTTGLLSPGVNVIKLFTAVIYCHSTVIPSFCVIKWYYYGNYCGMLVSNTMVIYHEKKVGTAVHYHIY